MGSIALFNKKPNKDINQIHPETSLLIHEPLNKKVEFDVQIKPIIKPKNSSKKKMHHYQTAHFEPIEEEEEEKSLDDSQNEVLIFQFLILYRNFVFYFFNNIK